MMYLIQLVLNIIQFLYRFEYKLKINQLRNRHIELDTNT